MIATPLGSIRINCNLPVTALKLNGSWFDNSGIQIGAQMGMTRTGLPLGFGPSLPLQNYEMAPARPVSPELRAQTGDALFSPAPPKFPSTNIRLPGLGGVFAYPLLSRPAMRRIAGEVGNVSSGSDLDIWENKDTNFIEVLLLAYEAICRCKPGSNDETLALQRLQEVHDYIGDGNIDYDKLLLETKQKISSAFVTVYTTNNNVISEHFLDAFKPEQRLQIIASFQDEWVQAQVLSSLVLEFESIGELFEYFGMIERHGEALYLEKGVIEIRELVGDDVCRTRTGDVVAILMKQIKEF